MQPKTEEQKPSYGNVSSSFSKPSEVKPKAPIIKRDLVAEAQK